MFDGDAFRERVDNDVFLKGCFALINQGDHGRVEFVFNGKHEFTVRGVPLFRKHLMFRGELWQRDVLIPWERFSICGGISMKRWLIPLFFLAACDVPTETAQPVERAATGATYSAPQAQRAFAQVRAVVEPVAERECKARVQGGNCDFKIGIGDDPEAPPNAYQTRDSNGRPLIIFTQAILPTFSNTHEIAFVMGHEAAHHIQGHLDRQSRDAAAGAIILAGIAAAAGGNSALVQQALDTGAFVGARSYSKEYELEADRLGTVITARAGYDPNRGLQYFFRLPDPGDRFLGSHPPNNDRITAVKKVIADNNF